MRNMLFLFLTILFLYSCGSAGDRAEEQKPGSSESPQNEGDLENGSEENAAYFIGREENRKNIRYHAMVDELLKGNLSSINPGDMRLQYAASTYYSPYETDKGIEMLKELYQTGQYAKVSQLTKQMIKVKAADINLHLYAMLAYKALGEEDFYTYHYLVMNALIQSIIKSGDGKTPETAYVVINVNEEYVVLNYLQYKISTQELKQFNNHSYDVFAVEKEGSPETLYFNVDLPIKWLESQMQ